ncbi:unnamed protein product [Prunus armeniaca]
MHHWQEQLLKSVPKPSGHDMGKRMVAAKPSASRHLFMSSQSQQWQSPKVSNILFFYTCRALEEAELWYPRLEKLAYAPIIFACKLQPYFQAHTIIVLTNQPLGQVLQRPETSGRAKFPTTLRTINWSTSQLSLVCERATAKRDEETAGTSFLSRWKVLIWAGLDR